MKIRYIPYFLLILLAIGTACTDDDNVLATPYIPDRGNPGPGPTPPNYTSGSADFSTYVAIGNSLTAGYADGALYMDGQENSFPNILAGQFALAGGGAFEQPLVNDNLGGLLLGGNQITNNRLFFDVTSQLPMVVNGTPTTEVSQVLSGPFNNMGIPGAKSFHLLANGYGNVAGVANGLANPFFARIASSPNASVLEDVLAQNPTFFTLWIGSNDVLSYATSGGAGEDHNVTGNLDPATYGGSDITNSTVFAQVYGGILTALSQSASGGVVVNIPNVTDAPFFTTVPYNPIPLDAGTAAFVNNAYTDYNNGLLLAEGGTLISSEERALRTINFQGIPNNAVVIVDEDLTDLSGLGLPSLRQATEEDLLVLTSRTVIGTLADPNNPTSVYGVGVALQDELVLTPQEQTAVVNATTAFNGTIATLASQFNYGLFDANALLNQIATNGLNIGGNAVITDDYVTGGAFSLDGIHPSPRGYAVTANAILEVVNTTYGANLPMVNPIEYTGLNVQ